MGFRAIATCHSTMINISACFQTWAMMIASPIRAFLPPISCFHRMTLGLLSLESFSCHMFCFSLTIALFFGYDDSQSRKGFPAPSS
jgi:hypothetical protein